MPSVPLLVVAMFSVAALAADAAAQTTFTAARRAEVLATVTVRCDACAWDVVGREAVTLAITLDDRAVQHLPVVRSGRADYHVLIGSVEPGSHVVRIGEDPDLTARDLRALRQAQGDLRPSTVEGHAIVERVAIEQIDEGSPAYRAISLAPIIYARPDTIGRFSDVPIFMWYELEPTPRGTRYRYSVIFTNEDGGTPADRLMATWGRTTDIEYLYSVEVDRRGTILGDDMQGPKHEILPFRGTREGRHPLLWVSTENNMVLDTGTTKVRYAPAPVEFPLRDVSREAVMDAHPWTYAVMAQELMREGKVMADAAPGNGKIPDPRHFVYLEACGELAGAALTFSVRVSPGGGTPAWIASDRGVPEYRIARDGCFRAAIPLPSSAAARDIRGLRAHAYIRPSSSGSPPKPQGPVRLTRINTMFLLDDRFRPTTFLFRWRGALTILPDGPPVELSLK